MKAIEREVQRLCDRLAGNEKLQTLIRMIEEDIPGSPTMDDVWSAFRVTLAAEQAIRTGSTVKVSDLA